MQPRDLFSLIPGFLDAATCRRLRAEMRRGVAEPAEVLELESAADHGARRAFDIDVDPTTLAEVEAKLESVRARIGTRHGLSITTREGAGFLSYGPGGFYRRHVDYAVDASWPEASRRRVSAVVFLNSSRLDPEPGECSGGELVLYPEPAGQALDGPVTIVPEEGTLVTFLAATPHEVKPITAGVRDVIVDWFY